jgi:hypothetical protein
MLIHIYIYYCNVFNINFQYIKIQYSYTNSLKRIVYILTI